MFYSVPSIQDISNLKMSNINATRIPSYARPYIPYAEDNVNHTLNRGERWAQHPSNDVPIVLIRCVLAFVEYHLVR